MMWALLDVQAHETFQDTFNKEVAKEGQLGPPVVAAIASSLSLSEFTVAEVCAFLMASGPGRAPADPRQPRLPPSHLPPPGSERMRAGHTSPPGPSPHPPQVNMGLGENRVSTEGSGRVGGSRCTPLGTAT